MQDQVQKLSQPVTQQSVLDHVKSMGLDPNNPAVRANMPNLMADLQATNEKRAATLAKVAGDMQRIDQMQSSIKIASQRAEEYRQKALLAPSETNMKKAKAAMELVKLAQKQVQEIGNKGAAGWFTGESPEHKAAADNLKDAEGKLKSSEEAVFGTPEVGADNAGFQDQIDELLATLRAKE
jgi:ABC-type enterochelin transport system substrate-binding protein